MDLRVLGPVQLHAGGRQLPLQGPRLRAVLGVLALHANRVVPSGRLLELVWGPAPPRTARNSLQGQVSRLRRLLAGAGDADRLIWRAPGYLLRLAPGELDVEEFKRLADEGRRRLALGDAEGASAVLHAALGLWRGRPLEDADLPGLRELLAGLERRRLAALEDRIDADLGRGCHGELVPELEALAAAWPLRERLRGLQMLALYRAGRPADALAAFRDTHAALRERLGADPGPELVRLQRAMLARDLSLEPPPVQPPAAAEPASGPPAQLPAAVASFVGRSGHLRALDALLQDQGAAPTAVVISAIAGMAGVGKTALAVHWAHRVADRFPDGQLYVDLRGWAPAAAPLRPEEALAGFLRALGVPAAQVPTEVEQAAGLYRTLLAERRALVVLDNARDADQVRLLLPGSPTCLVLVTSRDRLAGLVAVEGARPLPVDVLTPSEAHDLLAQVLGAERIAAEQPAAAQLARLCAYLPLALRITAANLTFHAQRTIAEHVAELAAGNRLAALEVRGDQQAAVRAAFGLSYATLAADARRLFRLLGLVPGPDVTAAAAGALAGIGTEQATRLLERLADAHLLAEPAPGRYAFHELLRLHAAEQAHAEDAAEARDAAVRRLLDWYLHSAAAAARLLYAHVLRLPLPAPERTAPAIGLDDHAQALAWLDAERENLLAAVQHAAASGPRPVAWLLANTLRHYVWTRPHAVDWLRVAHAALAAAEADGDPHGQAAARLGLADLHHRQGQDRQAVEHYAAALALTRQSGWLDGQSAALVGLGVVDWQAGRLEEATGHLTRALEIDRQTGWLDGQATALGNLGFVHWEAGRLQEATDDLTRALALYRQAGSPTGVAIGLGDLGGLLGELGRLDEAAELLTAAVALAREGGDRGAEGEILRMLAEVRRDAGRPADALEPAQAAAALAHDVGDRPYEIDALDTLATVQQHLGQLGQARACAEQALASARRIGYRLLEARALTTLAGVELDQGRADEARDHARQGLALHRASGQRGDQARALVILGHALQHGGDAGAARPCWQEALALLIETGSPEADQVRALLAGPTPP